jgi:hypothetical protein
VKRDDAVPFAAFVGLMLGVVALNAAILAGGAFIVAHVWQAVVTP